MVVRNACDIEKICSRIYSECDFLVTWKWDDHFQAVLSEFPADHEEEVMSVLEKHFDSCWDEETINYAPGKIRSVAKDLGALRRGQRRFSSDPDHEALFVAPGDENGEAFELIFADAHTDDADTGQTAPAIQSLRVPPGFDIQRDHADLDRHHRAFLDDG